MAPVDWSRCFICKNKTHKKSKDLINLCTFEACESIRIAAERKGDSSMLHILNGVNGDLIAAEAKYHKNCFATYVSKKTTLSLPKGEALDSPHERAFQDLAFDLAAGIEQGRAYDMMSLLSKYQEILTQKGADSPESYTTQNLKIRLQNHFSTSIVFHHPANRSKSELVYASTVNIQDVLNAWAVFHSPKNGSVSINNGNETPQSSEIRRVASLIKQEIKKCTGFNTKPLNTQDVSMETARQLIPDSLYLLIEQLVVSDKRARPSNALNQSTAIEDKRQILSIAQYIIHCNCKGRVKLPKHISLAICVHHLTTSKRLIELLNRMGHYVSYDEMRAVNTSIAGDILAKAEEFGTVTLTVIKAGSFVQIAADNNDLNEDTIDGKNTTHATTMVIYQNRTFSPDPPPSPVEQRPKRRSLQATGTVYNTLIESGVYAAGSTSALMKGKSYNRGIRAHNLCLEGFFRLMWDAFILWYESRDEKIPEERVLHKIVDCVRVVEYSFFLKAERTGYCKLHLSSTAAMLPQFFAMDRQNYAHYLPVYLADMQKLELTHPEVYKEFAEGNHSISRSGQTFSQVSTDMALEQSINADSKSSGGVIGISQSPSALERWFLTIHERASITSAFKAMFGLQDGEQASHKEAAPRRV